MVGRPRITQWRLQDFITWRLQGGTFNFQGMWNLAIPAFIIVFITKAGTGFLERGRKPRSPPHQVGNLGSAVSSASGVRGKAPKYKIWCNLRPQKSLQKWQINSYGDLARAVLAEWQCIARGVFKCEG